MKRVHIVRAGILICVIQLFANLLLSCNQFTSIPFEQNYETKQPSKTIHVVYDDSDSMVFDDVRNLYLDRWGQAKYAMEVFAAMLQENDEMRVYYMSDFIPDSLIPVRPDNNTELNNARIIIKGTDPAIDRVKKIHDTVTYSHGTPIDPVLKAYEDIKAANTDEKWLVVLTDGQFNYFQGRNVERDPAMKDTLDANFHFNRFVSESDVKIILLSMGEDAATITPNPARHIYFEQAKNSNEILGRITSICNLIFKRNNLEFSNISGYEFDFDIHMLELLVFAQGKDVKIDGITGTERFSRRYDPKEKVNVRYSETASLRRLNERIRISDNLTGEVATFKDIPKGRYRLDISGDGAVEIYFKPVVNIAIRLYDSKNKEILKQEIPDHEEYRIEFGLVDENGNFISSSLIGDIKADATLQNGGQTIPIISGNTYYFKEGEAAIDVRLNFLDVNTAEQNLTKKIKHLNIIQRYWYISFPLFLLAVLLLYWLLWGRKSRFPKNMAKNPEIVMERDDNTVKKYGSFKITPKTKWMPFCPETGTIVVVADGKPLPRLKVKALKNERMEITNADDFKENRLNGAEFYVNNVPLRSKEISCRANIKSVFYSNGIATTYTCSLSKGQRRNRKK